MTTQAEPTLEERVADLSRAFAKGDRVRARLMIFEAHTGVEVPEGTEGVVDLVSTRIPALVSVRWKLERSPVTITSIENLDRLDA